MASRKSKETPMAKTMLRARGSRTGILMVTDWAKMKVIHSVIDSGTLTGIEMLTVTRWG